MIVWDIRSQGKQWYRGPAAGNAFGHTLCPQKNEVLISKLLNCDPYREQWLHNYKKWQKTFIAPPSKSGKGPPARPHSTWLNLLGALFLRLLVNQIWFCNDHMTQTFSGIFTEHLKSQTWSSNTDYSTLFYVNLRFQWGSAVAGSSGERRQSKWIFHCTI